MGTGCRTSHNTFEAIKMARFAFSTVRQRLHAFGVMIGQKAINLGQIHSMQRLYQEGKPTYILQIKSA